MAKLNLSVAIGDYDRTRPLLDGVVAIDGVDPVYMALSPEEIFFRAFRGAEFDICEMSLSSYTVKTAQGDCPYVAVPAFLSRAFRHTSIYVRTDRVKKPADLKGRKVGVPEYQLTANVWARAFLDDDYGVKPADIHWIRGGIEEPGRPEKLKLNLPAGVRLDNAPEGATISALIESGEIDGFIAPRPPTLTAPRPCAGRLAVQRSGRGDQGLFQAHRLFSDHACRSACAARSPSAIRGFPPQCSRPSNGRSRRRSDNSPTRARRGSRLPFLEETLQRRARTDGNRFLALRRRAEPQGARLLSQPASCARFVGAATLGRRAVSPGDLRDVQGLIASFPTGRGDIASRAPFPDRRSDRRCLQSRPKCARGDR